MSTTFSKFRLEAKPFSPSLTANPKESAMNQLCQWGFQDKDQKIVDRILTEWFAAGTLENILTQWENIPRKEIESDQIPLNILCYNVQGWGSRNLEVIDTVYKLEAAVCVLTEVDDLWSHYKIPHFNTFHQHGTNKSGGVCVARGVSRYFYRRRRRVKSAEESVFGGGGEVLRISFHNLSGIAYHLSTVRFVDRYFVDKTFSTDILSIDTSSTADRSTAYLVELILST